MKEKIHPKWFPDARVHCACGNTFTTGSTLKEIAVEICSACHPLFTGQQKFVDTAGRVDKFNQRVAAAKQEEGRGGRAQAQEGRGSRSGGSNRAGTSRAGRFRAARPF